MLKLPRDIVAERGLVLLGEIVGNFRILARLGEGGMGTVYRAEHTGIQTSVAIKVLHEEISRDTGQVQRFFNEARIVSRIKHAGIAKIFDVGFFHKHAYLIMELLEGESLSSRLQRTGPMSGPQLPEFCRQIASVLHSTHRAGVTHRDLKPDNVFIVEDSELVSGERIKILDFGIAKLTGTLAASAPRTHGTMGTPAYMAPEQWGDSSRVDWRADAYSLGCVAFEMACGCPPFAARTIAEACSMHMYEAPPSSRTMRPDLPEKFDLLIAQLLAKHPQARGKSMGEIAAKFEMLTGHGGSARTNPRAGFSNIAASSDARPGFAATTIRGGAGELMNRNGVYVRWSAFARASVIGAAAIAVLGAIVLAIGRDDSRESKLATTRPAVVGQSAQIQREYTDSMSPVDSTVDDTAIDGRSAGPDAEAAVLSTTNDAATSEVLLHVDSDPQGAQVVRSLDGIRVGITPVDLVVPRGQEKVRLVVKKTGYRAQEIELSTAASTTKSVTLAKESAVRGGPELTYRRATTRSGSAPILPPGSPRGPVENRMSGSAKPAAGPDPGSLSVPPTGPAENRAPAPPPVAPASKRKRGDVSPNPYED